MNEDLAHEHEALTQFVYMAPVGLVQADMAGEIVMINPVAAQLMMPLSADGQLENLFTVLQDVAPDLPHRLSQFKLLQGTVCDGLQLPVSDARGGERRLLAFSLMKLDDQRIMCMLQDVTRQVKRERLLRQQEAWLQAILTGVSDYALVGLNHLGQVVDWNESVARVTGFSAEAVLRQSFTVFYPPDAISPERARDRLHEAQHAGWSVDDGWRVCADGARFWGSALIAPLQRGEPLGSDPDEASFCLILRDMSDHRQAAEQARQAAVCDHLTGLGNRRAFFDAAEVELRRWQRQQRPLSVVLFDADHFKAVNDTHGHPVGDAVLQHIAKTLLASFRQLDVVARIGGEEFAVLLPSATAAAAALVAERVQTALAASGVPVSDAVVNCTVSAGVAAMDESVRGLDDLLARADQALYAAKAAGRNRVQVFAGPLTSVGPAPGA
jgi:diguanylate cyclase (GGDEF)-like protein/PAS domain S-box-containing protein